MLSRETQRAALLLTLAHLVIPTLRATTPLTWDAASKEAARGNADLRAAEETVAKAQTQVGVSFSAFLPQVAGTISYSHGNASSASGTVSGGSSGSGTAFGVITTSDQYSLGLAASQNLFNGFQDRASLVQARANLIAAQSALRAQKATLHQSLKKAFYQLLYSQQAVVLSREIEKRRKGNFDLVELRFSGGRENKGSFLKTRGQWRQAQFQVRQNQRNILIAQQQLALLLGRRDFEGLEAVGTLTTKNLPQGLGDVRKLAGTVPSVEQSKAKLEAAVGASQAAFGTLLPSLTLNGSMSKVGLSFPPETDRWSVGLTLSIPIFRYSNFASLSGAHADERKAEFDLQTIDRQAAIALSTALTALQLAVEKVDVQGEVRQAALVRAEIARGQYTSGLITYNEWDLIESDLVTQDQALLTTKQEAVNAEADWEQALGRGDIP